MGTLVSFSCDHSGCRGESDLDPRLRKDVSGSIPVVFDLLNETWRDAIEFVRSAGWHIELANEPTDGLVKKVFCPKHTPKNKL